MERNVLVNQKPYPADFPDSCYLVPKDDLDKPLRQWPQQSERDTRQVMPLPRVPLTQITYCLWPFAHHL